MGTSTRMFVTVETRDVGTCTYIGGLGVLVGVVGCVRVSIRDVDVCKSNGETGGVDTCT